MIKKMGCLWRLRQLMAQQNMFSTTDLVPLLAERGINLSHEQVFRPVTQTPQRLSMDTLAALCDILTCSPNELIEVEVVNAAVRKPAAMGGDAAPAVRRTTVRRPQACDVHEQPVARNGRRPSRLRPTTAHASRRCGDIGLCENHSG